LQGIDFVQGFSGVVAGVIFAKVLILFDTRHGDVHGVVSTHGF
jgi:hypothetical protein